MIKDWLLNMLRCPDSGESLTLSADGQHLASGTLTFAVDDDIPSFITRQEDKTHFDYTAHYTADAEEFDYFSEESDKLTALHLKLLRTLVMNQAPASATLLLDVGCGSAFVAQHFCNQGKNVVSMDIAYANAHKALERFPLPNHAAVVADAYHLPFADGTFDCIIASEIIEHTIDPQGFAASLLTKLKPGGTLIISTPYKERIAYSLCIHCNCKTPHNAHLHSFDENKIRKIFSTLPAKIKSMRLVGNKLLLHSHLSVLLSHLGIKVWGCCDSIANRLIPKANHFIITIQKEA